MSQIKFYNEINIKVEWTSKLILLDTKDSTNISVIKLETIRNSLYLSK